MNTKIKRQYKNDKEEAAFENAIDCLVYGYGWSDWEAYDLPVTKKKEIWHHAIDILAKS